KRDRGTDQLQNQNWKSKTGDLGTRIRNSEINYCVSKTLQSNLPLFYHDSLSRHTGCSDATLGDVDVAARFRISHGMGDHRRDPRDRSLTGILRRNTRVTDEANRTKNRKSRQEWNRSRLGSNL